MLHWHCSRTSFFLIGFNVRKHLHAGNSLVIAKGLKLKLYDSLHSAACLRRWNCDLVAMESFCSPHQVLPVLITLLLIHALISKTSIFV